MIFVFAKEFDRENLTSNFFMIFQLKSRQRNCIEGTFIHLRGVDEGMVA